MNHEVNIIVSNDIQHRIFTIRDLQVMLDRDLEEIYGVENKRLNEQVKRNIERFPEGWVETTLGEHCLKIGSGSTPRGGNEAYKQEGISLIRSQNI